MVNFYKSPPSLLMNITCSFLYQIKIFFHLWISQEDNYKKKLNMKNNGIMYKELKLKKGNWIFKSIICVWITSLHFQWTCFSHFFIKLRKFYSIGRAKRRIKKIFWNVEGNGTMYNENKNWIIMFSFCKSFTSLSKHITCSIFRWFQQFFVPLDVPRKELKKLFQCQKKRSNSKSLNSKTQTELLRLVFANQPLHFQRA